MIQLLSVKILCHLSGNHQENSVKPVKYGAGDDDDSEIVTPEKIPVVVHIPRKSRSKDMSPPPLRHRQNRMPEQVELIKGDSKYIFIIF